MPDQKQTKRNLIFYPLGTIGRDMMYYLFTNCILTYIMFTKQLTDAQLLAITGIMIGARIFDGLNDPIMGNIIERTRTKWGKFKPWLLIGVVLTSIVIYLAFNNNLQGWPFIISFGIIYFAYSITYTMNDISYWGMVPALSSDADLRNKFTSRAVLFAGIGSTLATILIPILCHGDNALGGSAGKAYGIVALVIAILAPLFLLFTLFGVRERRDDQVGNKPKMRFRDIFSIIKSNDQLRWMILIFLIQQVGGSLVLGGIGQYFVYFRYGYEGGLFSIFSMVGVAATAILMLTYPMLSKKFSRKKLMSFGMISAAIGSVLEVVGGLLMPAEDPGSDARLHRADGRFHVREPGSLRVLPHHDDLHHEHCGIQRASDRTARRSRHFLHASAPDEAWQRDRGGSDLSDLSDFQRHGNDKPDLFI